MVRQTVNTGSMVSQRARWAAGQPISALMAQALNFPDLISLAAGFVDSATLPVDIVREATEHLLSDERTAREALQYGQTAGHPPLRDYLRQEMIAEGTDVSSLDQVILTAGSNQMLHLVAESILDPGDIVLCAAPTYFVFLGTLANLGVEAVGVETDSRGIVPEALEETWRGLVARGEEQRVKAIYLVTYFDNPRGITMPLERCEKIIRSAKRWSGRLPSDQRVYVLADEAYRRLRFGGEDVPSCLTLDEERDTVVATGTFSKSFAPGIRVGWGILPPKLVEPVYDHKGNIDFGSPNFNQLLMHEILRRGLFRPHVERLCREYDRKLQAMLSAMDDYLADIDGVSWVRPEGGLYVWLELPEGMSAGPDGPLYREAAQQGVLYVPGQYCFAQAGAPVRRGTMRLSFGVQSEENIRRGVEILAGAIRRAASDGGR